MIEEMPFTKFPNAEFANFDFASLYPATMRDLSGDSDLRRLWLKKKKQELRRKKLEQIENNTNPK